MTSIHYVENHFTLHSYLSMTPIPYTLGCLVPVYLILQTVFDHYTLFFRFSMTSIPYTRCCQWPLMTTMPNPQPFRLSLNTILYAPGCLWPLYQMLQVIYDHHTLCSRLSVTTILYLMLQVVYIYITLQGSVTTILYTPGCLWLV